MVERDLLEVSFLLDYLKSNPGLVTEWKGCSETERNKRFGAFEIRKFLDDRDGFTERRRAEHYKLLCSLGAHASYQGFQMLQPVRRRRCSLRTVLRGERVKRHAQRIGEDRCRRRW